MEKELKGEKSEGKKSQDCNETSDKVYTSSSILWRL